jgi:hypothetical protein
MTTTCREYEGSGRVEVSPQTEAWRRSGDSDACRGEPRDVPPGTYDVVKELREVAIVDDPDPRGVGSAAQGFFVINVEGEEVVVRSHDVSDAAPDSPDRP